MSESEGHIGGEAVLHVLFVCTGNICRSPMAERIAAMHAERMGIRDFKASSAGTRAVIGHPVHPEAALVLERLGAPASDFAARQLKPPIAADADLVLTMTMAHRDAVLELAPRQLNRTFTLSQAAYLVAEYGARSVAELPALRSHAATHRHPDIADPIGQDSGVFDAVGAQIAELIPTVLTLCR
ncbi:low molecular weight phosphatase family protein [Mycobacterium sp. CVI_P3]|uniref:Low molecular weight phosphatase family protein n=1 Tax=Mycobacterium pinniadriaticum TaxID=2994102 RepID=A0ABT3S974_9MYCO|nr:low molecular weight phosphatase family protein [Mycobacterium pinniadriaticum]MCX2928648.1 low molecular weight phosphatase family protein [Mycobacterium pinniadriaticum]MCX2935485.1 low molecular weight phosphatase family protein [Mycobacterium pinniadriaticum]